MGSRVVLFGGRLLGTDELSNEMHVLETGLMRWKTIKVKGEPPCARHSHAATAENGDLFIFGGEAEHELYLNDMHVFRPKEMSWITPRCHGVPPPPQKDAAMATSGTRLFVVSSKMPRVYSFDTATMTWCNVIDMHFLPPFFSVESHGKTLLAFVDSPRRGVGCFALDTSRLPYVGFDHVASLVADLGSLVPYSTGTAAPEAAALSDIFLVSSDGTQFSAHRALVKTRLPGLLAERESESRVMVPLCASTTCALLQYIYTGTVGAVCNADDESAILRLAGSDSGGVERLRDDMRRLLRSGADSDLTLVVEDKRFECHRAVLAARSPFFRAMLGANMVRLRLFVRLTW
eukprot:TRINITY_DN1801_c0_g1_i4.p2 TRINITY_DN1801_c0_g1~~TRINITY_DN1801_c0_g1_i4.p2  ORF type:complete len:347 (-),score=67.76 TRINITY_DN1801_c0_g1_i4:548-1588(-)